MICLTVIKTLLYILCSIETTLTLFLNLFDIGSRLGFTAGHDQPPIYGLDQYHVKLFISSRIYN